MYIGGLKKTRNPSCSDSIYNILTYIHPTHSTAFKYVTWERTSNKKKAIQDDKTKH